MENLISRIHCVAEILNDDRIEELSYDDALIIARLCFEYQDTNHIIDYTERLARKGHLAELMDFALALRVEASQLGEKVRIINRTVDFKAVACSYNNQMHALFEQKLRPVTEAYRLFTALSNKLDYLPLDTDEYRMLDKKTEAAKAEYERVRQLIPALEAERDSALKDSWMLFRLKVEDVELLCQRWRQIADTVIEDIKGWRAGE